MLDERKLLTLPWELDYVDHAGGRLTAKDDDGYFLELSMTVHPPSMLSKGMVDYKLHVFDNVDAEYTNRRQIGSFPVSDVLFRMVVEHVHGGSPAVSRAKFLDKYGVDNE